MANIAYAYDHLAPMLEHVAKVLNADYCARNPLAVGTWPTWEERTPEFKTYEYWSAKNTLAILLGLHENVRMERIKDKSRYVLAGKAALESARLMNNEPWWEDVYTDGVIHVLENAVASALEAARKGDG